MPTRFTFSLWAGKLFVLAVIAFPVAVFALFARYLYANFSSALATVFTILAALAVCAYFWAIIVVSFYKSNKYD